MGFRRSGAPLRRNPESAGKTLTFPSTPIDVRRKGVAQWTFLLGCVRFLVKDSTVVKLDLAKESVQASFSDLVSSVLGVKGPGDALQFLNALQPLLMEFLLLHGFSVSLQDFSVPKILLISGLRGVTGLSTTFLPPLNYFSHRY